MRAVAWQEPQRMANSQRRARHDDSSASRSLTRKVSVALWSMFGVAAIYAWSVDYFTASGERTVYTADCANGTWVGSRCTGKIIAGDRYRFRALRAHGEVIFWTVGSSEASGRFNGCSVEGGRDWSCPANAEVARTIALAMVHGRPVPDTLKRTRVFHRVSKLRWLALRQGLTFGATASE